MTETIAVAYVNQPKPGKKMGSIKTADGRFIGVWPDKLAQFRAGGTYVVELETQGDFTKLKRIVGAETAANGNKPARTDDTTAERIYVCGIVNAAVSAGRIEPTEASLIALTNTARRAYTQTFGGQGTKAENDGPDDGREIPF